MRPCLTVDVEDWYDGMAELGHPVRRHGPRRSGLDALIQLLSSPRDLPSSVTLFTVGAYAAEVGEDLRHLAGEGHEIASHGAHHGPLPAESRALEAWLRQSREQVEEVVQRACTGFRSPCFRLPEGMTLAQYRDLLASAGFSYVSDRHRLGARSPVVELPVLEWRGIPLGGGSYQRLLPREVAVRAIATTLRADARVLYYHSYDFGEILPTVRQDRSPAVLRFSAGRSRVAPVFERLLERLGSVSCQQVLHAV